LIFMATCAVFGSRPTAQKEPKQARLCSSQSTP
jgi:hypothetical protein